MFFAVAPGPAGRPAPAAQAPAQQPPPAPAAPSPIIVLDPAHGGTDTGARGENGIVEKDIVLEIARTLRAELERQGFRVVLTREGDADPSYDDRAAAANAHRDALLISLHIASTGKPGTVRSYYERFSTEPPSPAAPAAGAQAKSANPPPNTLIPWREAQRTSAAASRNLAELLQLELARGFAGSPAQPVAAAVRELRSVSGPAVAVEISSVSVSNAEMLTGMAGPLGLAIGRSIQAFRAETALAPKS